MPTRCAGGLWPYSDFPLEYPPLAVPFFLLAPKGASVAVYERWFSIEMIAVMTGAALLTTLTAVRLWRGLERPLAAAAAFAVLTLAAGAVAATHYDAVVAAVFAGALLALVRRRPAVAALLVGLGFALKLTPAVLLPLVLLVTKGRRRAAVAAGVFALAAILPFAVFAVHSTQGLTYPIRYHAERPLQIESVLATPYLAAVLSDDRDVSFVGSYGSMNVSAPGARFAAQLSPWLLAAAIGLLYVFVWKARQALRNPEQLVAVTLALVLALVCTSKVLSPQYLVWILPVVALCLAGHLPLPRVAAALCLIAMLLTQIEFPGLYVRFVHFNSGPTVVVILRNLILVAAGVVAAAHVVRLRSACQEETRAEPSAVDESCAPPSGTS